MRVCGCIHQPSTRPGSSLVLLLYRGNVACLSFPCVHFRATYVCTSVTHLCKVPHGQMYILNVLNGDVEASWCKINKVGFMSLTCAIILCFSCLHPHTPTSEENIIILWGKSLLQYPDQHWLPWWSLSIFREDELLFDSRTDSSTSIQPPVVYWSLLLPGFAIYPVLCKCLFLLWSVSQIVTFQTSLLFGLNVLD